MYVLSSAFQTYIGDYDHVAGLIPFRMKALKVLRTWLIRLKFRFKFVLAVPRADKTYDTPEDARIHRLGCVRTYPLF